MEYRKLSKIPKNPKLATYEFKPDQEKGCGECNLCAKVCEEMGIGAISMVTNGVFSKADIVNNDISRQCIGCMMCAYICPKNLIKVIDKSDEREIWNRKFKLVKCEDCGKYYATEEHVRYAHNRDGIIPDKLICEKCKRKLSAKNIKQYVCKV